MSTEARKLAIVNNVLEVKDEAVLLELEAILKKSKSNKNRRTFSAHDFLGIWSKSDADQIAKAIEESNELSCLGI